MITTPPSTSAPVRRPAGLRLWLAVAAVMLVAATIDSYGIASWPMADDEVPSLIEMGIIQQDVRTLSVPASQVVRLRKTLPIWYESQRWLIDRLGAREVDYRLPSVAYAVLAIGLAFACGARWRGWRFAVALTIVVNGSQLFVYLAQIDRFYSLTLLILTVTFLAIWLPVRSARAQLGMCVLSAVLGAVCILTHNLTMVLCLLAAIASIAGVVFGWVPRRVAWRAGAAAAGSLGVYVAYVRPLIAGWNSTGNPTPILISYAAEASVPIVALSLMGIWFAWQERRTDARPLWWALMFGGSFCVYLLAWFNWNPRYFALFLPATWVLASVAIEGVATAIASLAGTVVWYGVVVVLLLPGLVSHFQDGSRHDYREAAAVVAGAASGDEAILSDDAETMSYYLPDRLRARLEVRTRVLNLPAGSFLLVTRSNAWIAQPRVPGRELSLLAEISRRRFDEFSHVLRVYRVGPVR